MISGTRVCVCECGREKESRLPFVFDILGASVAGVRGPAAAASVSGGASLDDSHSQ